MSGAVPALLTLSLFLAATPLKLWHAYRGGEEQALQELSKQFSAETGNPVELLAVPYDAFSAKLTSTIPHGAGPDVFIFAHERLRQFQRLDVVAPSQLDRAEYLEAAVDALEVDGRHFGYPLALKCLAMYRNTALLDRPVESTAELFERLKPFVVPAQNRFALAYESGDFFYHAPIYFGFGGKLFDEGTGRSTMNTPEMAASFRFIRSLQERGTMPQEVSGALVKSLFNDRKTPLVISGPWFAGEIDPTLSYAVDPLPVIAETGLPMRSFLGVEASFVSSRTAHPQEADALARFISTHFQKRVELGRQIPAVRDLPDDPFIAAFATAARTATPTPNTLEMARVWEPMKLALRAVLQGTASPNSAGAVADRRYRALNRDAPAAANPVPWLLGLGLALAVAITVLWRGRSRERYPDLKRAITYVAPGAAGTLLLVIVPLLAGISLSFFHHEGGHYRFVGLANFADILASRGYSVTEPLSFYFTLAVTVLWTAANVVLHVSIGLGMALLLKSPLLRLRGVYRMLLIVPWAVPSYITANIWKTLFHRQFGAVNGLLIWLGIEPISWFTRWATAFAANVATNTWLGFPFMMVVALGALQSIPPDLYEAAEVDGASKWAQFRHITLPLLKPALLPAVILGTVWTFNMFNVIYLVSGGEPGGATDILVSEAYRWAFQRNEQYGFAAAYSVLIFVVLIAWSRLTRRMAAAEGAT
ncbi:MAG: extracellular solute-binding protein [Archangiaceae bacterium]|nr:extracellular solute-binding protein [Archangiaceae bacterium]